MCHWEKSRHQPPPGRAATGSGAERAATGMKSRRQTLGHYILATGCQQLGNSVVACIPYCMLHAAYRPGKSNIRTMCSSEGLQTQFTVHCSTLTCRDPAILQHKHSNVPTACRAAHNCFDNHKVCLGDVCCRSPSSSKQARLCWKGGLIMCCAALNSNRQAFGGQQRVLQQQAWHDSSCSAQA